MTRKRGPYERTEKIFKKKRSETPKPESSPEDKPRNILNDHILNLYKKDAQLVGETSLNSTPISTEPNLPNDEKKEPKPVPATPASKSSKSFKSIEKKNFSGFTIKRPTVTCKDVSGLDDIVEKILRIFFRIKDPEVFAALNVEKGDSIILHGPSGCGKTHLVYAIAGETKLPLLEVSTTQLVGGVSGESENNIREIFDEAVKNAPCILFLDHIDVIALKINSSDSRGMEKRMVTQLLTSLDALKENDNASSVMVIAATNRLDSIEPALLSRFFYEIPVRIPNEKARLKILQVLTKCFNFAPDFDMEWLAHNTPGYVGADLSRLVKTSQYIAVNRMYDKYFDMNIEELKSDSNLHCSDYDSNSSKDRVLLYTNSEKKISVEEAKNTMIELQDFKEALKYITPSSTREGFCTVPNVTWEDVGALGDIKQELQETIIWPVKYRELYENSNMESSKGILLYGPKGCGKTLLAKVIANEGSINFLSVKGPELLNMYLGESERAVRQCFQRARNSAPCVIFFDEIDALCPERTGSNANAAAERVVNMLLTEMDGMEERNQVFVIGATNRLEKIDSAMLRPGRLEKIIYIGLPSPADRKDILKSITKNKTKPKISDDVDFEKIGHDIRCDNFSGADIANLVREATLNAVREYIKTPESRKDVIVEVKFRHFEEAFSKVKPSVTEKDKRYFQMISGQRCQ